MHNKLLNKCASTLQSRSNDLYIIQFPFNKFLTCSQMFCVSHMSHNKHNLFTYTPITSWYL